MLNGYNVKLIELKDDSESQYNFGAKEHKHFSIRLPNNSNSRRYGLPIEVAIANVGKQQFINLDVFLSFTQKQPHIGDNIFKLNKEGLANEQVFKFQYGNKDDNMSCLYMTIRCNLDNKIQIRTKYNVMFQI